MNVLLLVPEFPPDSIGGGGVVFEALRDEYAKRHTVSVVAGSTGEPLDASAQSSGVTRIRELPVTRGMKYLQTVLPPTPAGALALSSTIRGFDVVHAHGFGFPVVDIGVRLAARRRIPVLHTLHGHPVTHMTRGLALRSAFLAYERMSGRPALRRAAMHTAVSDTVASLFRERYAINATTVPNGVELPSEEPWPEFDDLCDVGDVIVAVGRLEWIKGFDTIVRAVALLPPESRPRVAFVGADHGYLGELLGLAASEGVLDYCRFLGKQSRGRLVHAFKRAKACVVASHVEAFPAVPLEAMLAGCALVTTRLPSVCAYAQEEVDCLFFDFDDRTSLASLIARVCRDDSLRQSLRANGKLTAAQFRWERVANQYEGLLSQLIEDRREPSTN